MAGATEGLGQISYNVAGLLGRVGAWACKDMGFANSEYLYT